MGTQIVQASEKMYVNATSGLYSAQYQGVKKGTMKPAYVSVVETGANGWYKVNTWLGELWVKNGYQETTSPEMVVEYTYLTKTSGLFKEINKDLVSFAKPTRVVLLETGENGWMRINTWLGPLWAKDGVLEVEVAPVEEPEVPVVPEPVVVVPPVEPEPEPEIPVEPVVPEETPEQPNDTGEASPPLSVLKTKYISDIFDSQDGNRTGTIAPTTLTVVGVGTNGWYQVNTWLGPMWTKDGYVKLNGYEKPVLPSLDEVGTITFPTVSFPAKDNPIGTFNITKKSGMYADPSSVERLGVLNPQRVYVIENGTDGWIKVNTNWGHVWIKDGYNSYRSYFPENIVLTNSPGGGKIASAGPTYTVVIEERTDGWKKVQTWLGEKWTINNSYVIPIHNYSDKTKEHIYVLRDTAIMEKMMYDYKNVGIAKGGQYFVMIGETDTSYVIDFGYGLGHINKSDAEKTDKAAYNNRITQKETNDVLITHRDSIVFDLKGSFYHQIGSIKADMRYPIVKELTGFYIVDFGGREGYVAKNTATKDTKGIPALMYHHFLKLSENKTFTNTGTTITPEQFEKEMALLKREGFTTITPEMMEAYVLKKGNLPGKTVIITSDDGYKSNYQYMYPIMKKYGHQGSIFIITGYTQPRPIPWEFDSKTHMSIEELSQTVKDGVFNLHGHTDKKHYIVNGWGAIVSEPYEVIIEDTKLSKEKLEFWGYKPRAFAYPFGSYSPATIEILKEAGYTSAYTVKPGYNKPGDSIYELRRWNIGPGMSERDYLDVLYSRK
jgi:peptidoglycan/xylan/chitin deacetylase (PgdA/CDA1 family)